MMKLIWTFLWLVLAVEAAPCKDNKQCTVCDINGQCISECAIGYYGYQCENRCSPRCKRDVCYLTTSGYGKCTNGCTAGFYGTRCNIPCKTHVQTCKKCPQECEGGFCQLGSSCAQGCQDSYYGTACRSCPAGCEVCNRVSGTCEVCLRCEGDCTHGCLEGCTTGYFGDFCEHTCSSGCLSGCNQISGDCFKCKPGMFGATCDKQCPKRCFDEECDMDEICTNGCIEGWYGSKCESKCSSNCLNEECSIDGICTRGCTQRFYGPRCDAKCETGCVEGICDRNGKCTDGCKTGFHGEQCQDKCPESCSKKLCHIENSTCKPCEKGFHGSHCGKSCVRCVEDSCRQDTGQCIQGCLSNFKGELCQHDCAENCGTVECRDVCKTEYDMNRISGQDYMPYWVAAAVVVIVAVLVIYAACRFKRLQRVIYGSRKGAQRQEHQPQRDQTEEPAEPNVHFYCEVDEGVMTPARLPRVCTAQIALTGDTASSETSSQSRQDADQEGTSNNLEPVAPYTDASVLSGVTVSDGTTADLLQCEQSDGNSSPTAIAPNIDEASFDQATFAAVPNVQAKSPGSDLSVPEKVDMTCSSEPQRGRLPKLTVDITEYRQDHVSVPKAKSQIDDGPPLNDDAEGPECDAAVGINGYDRARGFGTSPSLVTECTDDGEADEELPNISVPVIADCYDNFSVDDDEEVVPVPPNENYSKFFTTDYACR